MQKLITSRAQREAVYSLFERNYQNPLNRRAAYREYRKRFKWSGVCGDYYLFGQPFDGSPLWVGIETDGYTHS